MMYRLLFLYIALLYPLMLGAQQLKVNNIVSVEPSSGISVKDINGNLCACLFINIDEPNIEFEGNVVKYNRIHGGYNVWVLSGTRKVTIYSNHYLPCEIKINDFGHKYFSSKASYRVDIIKAHQKQTWEKEEIRNLISDDGFNWFIRYEKADSLLRISSKCGIWVIRLQDELEMPYDEFMETRFYKYLAEKNFWNVLFALKLDSRSEADIYTPECDETKDMFINMAHKNKDLFRFNPGLYNYLFRSDDLDGKFFDADSPDIKLQKLLTQKGIIRVIPGGGWGEKAEVLVLPRYPKTYYIKQSIENIEIMKLVMSISSMDPSFVNTRVKIKDDYIKIEIEKNKDATFYLSPEYSNRELDDLLYCIVRYNRLISLCEKADVSGISF